MLVAIFVAGLTTPGFFASAATYPAPPVIFTITIESTTATSVTLEATVNPGGAPAVAWVEYGTTTALGQTTRSFPLNSGRDAVRFTVIVNELVTNTIYYYRVVADNTYGTTRSSIASVTPGYTPPPSNGPSPMPDLSGLASSLSQLQQGLGGLSKTIATMPPKQVVEKQVVTAQQVTNEPMLPQEEKKSGFSNRLLAAVANYIPNPFDLSLKESVIPFLVIVLVAVLGILFVRRILLM